MCQQIAQAEPLCELTISINEQVEKARDELNQAEEAITAYLEWQDSNQGKAANLPRILETYKDILFTEWHTQVMKAERAASRCRSTSSNLVDLVNNTLLGEYDFPMYTRKDDNNKYIGAIMLP